MNIWKRLFGGGSTPPIVTRQTSAPAAQPPPTSGEKALASESKKQLSEEERKSIYSEFHRFLNTHAMMEAASRGLGERAGIEFALTKASEYIERSYSMSFDQWTAIFKEGQSKKWDKWP